MWLLLLPNLLANSSCVTTSVSCSFLYAVASSISYMITECTVDVARAKATYDEVTSLIKKLKESGGESK